MSEQTAGADAPMEAEFDVMAGWTREAVQRLGAHYAVPAACRGSASPAALTWLGEACALTAGTRLLDAGAGMGGPAAFAAERFGARPLLVEPMRGACRTAAALFDLPVAVGSGTALPVAAGAVEVVWCVGVLCTVPDHGRLLAELRRVLVPGGRLGLFVLVAAEPEPDGAPEGNHFPTDAELAAALPAAGFAPLAQRDLAGLAAPPPDWTARMERVEQAVADAHGDDPQFTQAQAQEERMGDLLGRGAVRGVLLAARAR